MSKHLESLYQNLLNGKLPHNLGWSEAVELVEHLGEVQPHGGDEFFFRVGSQRVFFKRPQTHDLGLEEVSRLRRGPRTLKELVDHWLDTECPETDEDPNERRAFSTRDNYRGYLRKCVKPRCGDQALDEVKAVAIESWLSTLKKDDGTALADGSKKKIRGLRHLLYEHAIRYEWTDRNPITSVRQSGVRQATPIRLSVDQLSPTYYGELKQRERVMVLLDFGRIPFSIV